MGSTQMEKPAIFVVFIGGALAWGRRRCLRMVECVPTSSSSLRVRCVLVAVCGNSWSYNVYKCVQAGGFAHVIAGVCYASRRVFRRRFLEKLGRTLSLFRTARQVGADVLLWASPRHICSLTPEHFRVTVVAFRFGNRDQRCRPLRYILSNSAPASWNSVPGTIVK